MVANDKQARMWGMLCHLTALAGFVGIPFGHLIGPLVVWLIKKNEFPLVDEQGKESLNFQLTMTVFGLIAALLMFIFVGVILLIGLAIADLALVIIASIKASNGESYKYPYTIKFIK